MDIRCVAHGSSGVISGRAESAFGTHPEPRRPANLVTVCDARGVSSMTATVKILQFFDSPGAQLLPDGHARRGISDVAALSEWLVHANRRQDGAWTQRYEHRIPVTGWCRSPAAARPAPRFTCTRTRPSGPGVRTGSSMLCSWPCRGQNFGRRSVTSRTHNLLRQGPTIDPQRPSRNHSHSGCDRVSLLTLVGTYSRRWAPGSLPLVRGGALSVRKSCQDVSSSGCVWPCGPGLAVSCLSAEASASNSSNCPSRGRSRRPTARGRARARRRHARPRS